MCTIYQIHLYRYHIDLCVAAYGPMCIYIYIYIYIYQDLPRGYVLEPYIECALRGYVSTPLSRTKKTQQDMVTTMLIAPFLGETLGGELNNKKNDLGKSDTQMTRSPW